MAEEKTVVVFRKFPDGDIVALFPEIPSDPFGEFCMSYMHVGQHGSAECPLEDTSPAKPSEYRNLKKELESPPFGYNLDVRDKITSAMHRKRRAWAKSNADV